MFLAVEAALIISIIATSGSVSRALGTVVVALGAVALAVGVWWQQPEDRIGWWLLVAGLGSAAAAAVALKVGVRDVIGWDWYPAVLVAVSLPLLVGGLVMLMRLGGRPAAVDVIDAVLVALGTFQVLFSFVLQPVVIGGAAEVVAAWTVSVAAFCAFATGVLVAFTVRPLTVALGLALCAVGAFVGLVMSILVVSLISGVWQASVLSIGMYLAWGTLMGLAGLHPSLSRTRYTRPRQRPEALSVWRMVLFCLLAVVTPVARGIEVRRAVVADVTAMAVPVAIVTSAVFLLLLVARLIVTTRMAQRRANQLAHRTGELVEAVEEQKTLQRQLRYQAMHDPLTGMANRVVLTERMEWALTRPTGSREHAVALLDLDGFKDVNDTLGHPVGDELLKEVSRRLLRVTPRGGTLARLGGDEFAALLEDTTLAQATAWAEDVRQALRQPYHVAGHDLYLSTSIGLLAIRPTGPPYGPAEALRDADLALYAAKEAGKNCVEVYRPALRAARLDYTRLSTGLRRALARDELTIEYQPVVNLATHQIVAVEALLRWAPPGQPVIKPEEFLPVADDTGLIVPIGAWVVQKACHDARGWHDTYGIATAVNVSARQLDDPNFAGIVGTALDTADLPGDALILEITETSLVASTSTSTAMHQLDRLRRRGVRIAIDDFGTGYSSLAYVSQLPVDMVKVDKSFVQQPRASTVDQSWSVTEVILQLAATLELQAVAEGVETLDQAEALRRLDCPLAQGYLFARPVPPGILDDILASWNTSLDVTHAK